jgi:Flp pilus assembly pilin Flp
MKNNDTMMIVSHIDLGATIRKFIKNRKAATMVEYAILLTLILLVAYRSFGTLGAGVNSKGKLANAALNHKASSSPTK